MFDVNSQDIRVILVDHSALARTIISDTLQSDPRIKVVDVSRDGSNIIEKIKLHKPDVIAVDAQIPDEGGMRCLREIMQNNPLPVIMMSKDHEHYERQKTRALDLGARDFINKPNNLLNFKDELIKKDFIKKIHRAKGLQYNHIKNIYPKSYQIEYNREINRSSINNNKHNNNLKIKNIFAIGTSTGGPKALQSVIPLIPKDMPATYLIVQHMPPVFTKLLAERLDSVSNISVREAEQNEVIKAGVAYIAPGGYHMLVDYDKRKGDVRIKLSKMSPIRGLRPAANMLFNSLAETGLTNLVGIIMTGMGTDGCEGLINMKLKNNAHIIAESEESCVIFGMPKAVINAGIADKIVPVTRITNEMINYVGVDSNGYESIH